MIEILANFLKITSLNLPTGSIITLKESTSNMDIFILMTWFTMIPVMKVVVLISLEVIFPATVRRSRTDQKMNSIPPTSMLMVKQINYFNLTWRQRVWCKQGRKVQDRSSSKDVQLDAWKDLESLEFVQFYSFLPAKGSISVFLWWRLWMYL